MGTVYLAMQDEPRRHVALKLMKHGVASRSALRRFKFEAQLLARLRHPGIAQIYESGTHDTGTGGVPYFAIEYVPGALPLTTYAKEKKLDIGKRMELFAEVCDAVAHGHQKGIIHRDLKPANILVDSHGRPRIIDFGVARATDSDLAVTTLQTDLHQIIGTLQYMSPEQCGNDALDIDTSSDVYALGVVLYELLCDQLPYDISSLLLPAAIETIRTTEPARPSTIYRSLRGDLETIVLKALNKERDRRPYVHGVRQCSGGSGLLSTAPDYLRFAEMLRQRGAYADARVLSPESLDLMTSNHLSGDLEAMALSSYSEMPYQGFGFGLGVAVMLDPARAKFRGTIGDFGWGGAASTYFWVDPANDMTVLFVTQLVPSTTYPLREELRALVYDSLID